MAHQCVFTSGSSGFVIAVPSKAKHAASITAFVDVTILVAMTNSFSVCCGQ